MPYAKIREPDGSYKVINKDSGKVHSAHTTEDKASAQLRLLRGIEYDPNFIPRKRPVRHIPK